MAPIKVATKDALKSEQGTGMFPEQNGKKLKPVGRSAMLTFKNGDRRTLQVRDSYQLPTCSCLHAFICDAICDS